MPWPSIPQAPPWPWAVETASCGSSTARPGPPASASLPRSSTRRPWPDRHCPCRGPPSRRWNRSPLRPLRWRRSRSSRRRSRWQGRLPRPSWWSQANSSTAARSISPAACGSKLRQWPPNRSSRPARAAFSGRSPTARARSASSMATAPARSRSPCLSAWSALAAGQTSTSFATSTRYSRSSAAIRAPATEPRKARTASSCRSAATIRSLTCVRSPTTTPAVASTSPAPTTA